MSKNTLPYHKRIQDAIDKVGTANGLKIPDAQLPDSIDQKNNVEVNEFFDKHAIVKEYLILDIISKHVEGRHRVAKKRVLSTLRIDEAALTAGDAKTYTFDNVNLSYKVTNGRANFNKELMLVCLMSKLDKLVPGVRNLSLSEAQAVIESATATGKPPLSLIPATTAE